MTNRRGRVIDRARALAEALRGDAVRAVSAGVAARHATQRSAWNVTAVALRITHGACRCPATGCTLGT